MTSTVFVIIPGAFHVPYHFELVGSRLIERGHTVDILHLPSVSDSPLANVFDADVETIKSAIARHTAAGQDVVLLAHSYGGIPLTEAAFLTSEQQTNASHGAVIQLIYLCAFMLLEGESISTASADFCLVGYPDENSGGVVHAQSPREVFYNDVPGQLADAAVSRLRPMALAHAFSAPERCAWRVVPTGYVFCERDNAIPLAAQKLMVERARAQGVGVQTVSLDAGHSPFLSMPDKTVDAVEQLVDRCRRG